MDDPRTRDVIPLAANDIHLVMQNDISDTPRVPWNSRLQCEKLPRLTWGSSSGRVRWACRGHPPAPKRISSAPRSPWPIPGSSRCGEERLRRVGAWEGGRQSKYLGDTATRLGLASRSGLDRSRVCGIDGLARPVCSVRPRLWTCSRSTNPSREAMDDRGQSPARPTGWKGG